MIMLGVALAPSDSYACGSKSGKSCCKKENVESHSTKKSAAKACCSKGKKGIKTQKGGKERLSHFLTAGPHVTLVSLSLLRIRILPRLPAKYLQSSQQQSCGPESANAVLSK